MRDAISTSRFIPIMRVAASVSRIAAFQFERSCHRGGWMKSSTPMSAERGDVTLGGDVDRLQVGVKEHFVALAIVACRQCLRDRLPGRRIEIQRQRGEEHRAVVAGEIGEIAQGAEVGRGGKNHGDRDAPSQAAFARAANSSSSRGKSTGHVAIVTTARSHVDIGAAPRVEMR